MSKCREAIIRAAATSDVESIARIHTEVWRESYRVLLPAELITAQTYDRRLNFRQQSLGDKNTVMNTFVACRERRIIEFIDVGPARDKDVGFEGECYALYVLSTTQRKGVGRILFSAGLESLIGSGRSSSYVWVLKNNLPACEFYAAMGGVEGQQRSQRRGTFEIQETAYGWKFISDTLFFLKRSEG